MIQAASFAVLYLKCHALSKTNFCLRNKYCSSGEIVYFYQFIFFSSNNKQYGSTFFER